MRNATIFAFATVLVFGAAATQLGAQVALPRQVSARGALASISEYVHERMQADVAALESYRPGFPFWRYVFTVPDGAIVFASATDGHLIATLPASGDWLRDGAWETPALRQILDGRELPADLSERRDELARLLEPVTGPVVHNASRGLFLQPNERRYGAFINEWAEIYERFGVSGEVGLAQALVESGLNGAARSEQRAVGFCQWLDGNWKRLQQLAPVVIESQNQTTQAPYCAAYLSILAVKYGSFIPALSEHHAGGTNIGRILINGERLGGITTRDRYFLGSDFVRDLRLMSPGTYRDIYGSYGPRSIHYAEMIFGNIANVERIRREVPQQKIFAMRVSRRQTLADIARRTKLSTDELRRYNPALARSVPANATLYLPKQVSGLGQDVAFWHRPATTTYATVLDEFLHLDVSPDEWDSPTFDSVLDHFRTRFAATHTEEGAIMATTLAYQMQDRRGSRQSEILADFRASDEIRQLFDDAREKRDVFVKEGASPLSTQ
jgi:hypothetical protein